MILTKSQKRLFIVLAIILSYAVTDFFINKEHYIRFYFTENGKTGEPGTPLVNEKTQIVNSPETKIRLEWKRNPFREIGKNPAAKIKKPSAGPKLVLQAITCSDKNSFVMINDLILKEGEFIAGYQISKIFPNRVRLTENGKSLYLQTK